MPWRPKSARSRRIMVKQAERERKRARIKIEKAAHDLLAELQNIANATLANFENDTEFRLWAQSRARFAIAKAKGDS